MKKGEKVYRIKALWTVKCHECHGYIYAGQTFLLDQIPYYKNSAWGPSMKHTHNHIIHEGHWKGPKNVIIDLSNKPRKTPRRHPYSRRGRVIRNY